MSSPHTSIDLLDSAPNERHFPELFRSSRSWTVRHFPFEKGATSPRHFLPHTCDGPRYQLATGSASNWQQKPLNCSTVRANGSLKRHTGRNNLPYTDRAKMCLEESPWSVGPPRMLAPQLALLRKPSQALIRTQQKHHQQPAEHNKRSGC